MGRWAQRGEGAGRRGGDGGGYLLCGWKRLVLVVSVVGLSVYGRGKSDSGFCRCGLAVCLSLGAGRGGEGEGGGGVSYQNVCFVRDCLLYWANAAVRGTFELTFLRVKRRGRRSLFSFNKHGVRARATQTKAERAGGAPIVIFG